MNQSQPLPLPVEVPPEPRVLPLSPGATYGTSHGKGRRDLMEPEWDGDHSWETFDFKGCREGWGR